VSITKKLITICVVSFNSSSTIIDTLESIKRQTYETKLIELIIADDCSQDNTIDIVQSWLKENQEIFHDAKLIKRKMNVGLTKNINEAWQSANGEWIKSIAADDILMDSCITDNIDFATLNDINSVVFSLMQSFTSEGLDGIIYPSILQRSKLQASREIQLDFLTSAGGFACAPSAFIHRGMLQKINFADERFTMLEDSPLWLRILETGAKLHLMNIVTVKYRIGTSISQSKGTLFNFGHLLQRLSVDFILFRKYCSFSVNLRKSIFYTICIVMSLILGTENTKVNKFIYRTALLFKPYWLKDKLTK